MIRWNFKNYFLSFRGKVKCSSKEGKRTITKAAEAEKQDYIKLTGVDIEC